MKAKLVYGAPCSGKSTYVYNHAGENDVIWDLDKILNAATVRKDHVTKKHPAHWQIFNLRKKFVAEMCKNEEIELLWVIVRWPTDRAKRDMEVCEEVEEVFIKATKQECYERLDGDDSRPDKDAWRKVIDDWFSQYGDEEDEVAAARARLHILCQKRRIKHES